MTVPTDRTKMVLSKIVQEFKRICTIEIRNNGFAKISNGSVRFMIELLGMKKNYSISENISSKMHQNGKLIKNL